MHSLNNVDGNLCVDIFIRPDASFSFEEYRRDSEDGRGWFPVGRYGEIRFTSEEDALARARELVAWLKSK